MMSVVNLVDLSKLAWVVEIIKLQVDFLNFDTNFFDFVHFLLHFLPKRAPSPFSVGDIYHQMISFLEPGRGKSVRSLPM